MYNVWYWSGGHRVCCGLVGGAVGQWAAKGGLSFVSSMGYTIQSPVVKGAIGGFFGGVGGGYAGGFTASFAATFVKTGNMDEAISAGHKSGINGAITGGPLGLVGGAFAGFKVAKDRNIDPWNGKRLNNASSNELMDAFGIKETIDRINRGESYNHRNDGTTFRNDKGFLPELEFGSYTEYVHPTPGVNHAGMQRIVIDPSGETYYTPDHYSTFFRIK